MQKTLAIFILLLPLHLSAASALQVINLRCEYRSNPLGIDVAQPRFSWTFQSSARNQSQNAYEIVVHPEQVALEQLRGTSLWSTGKISSTQNIQIEYKGPALQPFTRYYWKVRVYDQNGEPSPWSKIAWFETAMLRAEDWQAQWINDGSQLPAEEEKYYADDPMPLFRKAFNASKKLNSARLYICGLGYYEAFLNGQKIGDHVLDPGFTTYRKQALYASYDISTQVQKGANTLGVMLGNGWWNPLPLRMFGRWDLRQFQQTGRPCLRAELHLHYTDGSKEIISSNNTWQVAPGPVLRNNVYLGEHYDARLERSFTEVEGWRNASLTAGPSGGLSAQMQPPIRVTKTIPARKVKSIGQDTFLVDFGQNFAGVLRLRVQGPGGQKITLRYAEDTLKNGEINWWTTVAGQIKEAWGIKGGPGAPKTAWQQDEYTLKGGGIETWSPRFTFHGYRYVEVVGWPGVPKVEDFTGLRLNTDLPQVGTFVCSNPLFNQLHEVIQWTFLSNVFSVQSDCPAREKMGYGADMVVSAEAFMYNYDMAQFYHKTVRDFANEQRPEGGITEIAPFTGIADRGYGDLSGPLGWQLGFPFLQKKLYEFYGDKRVIEQYYPAFERQMAFLQNKAVDHLFYWDISDHEALDTKPEAFSAAAFYYHHALLMQEFSGILDKKEAVEKYRKLAENIKRAILRRYHLNGTGRFDNATQSAQLFALWYGLAPDRKAALDVLQQELQRHKMHLSTGIFSTKFLFDVLREENLNDWAYQVANQRDFPGWGHMLAEGATTLWESWAYPGLVYSANHPMFGSIDEWFYRALLGINPAAPGFAKVRIQPQPAGDLTWAKGAYESIRGRIETEWKIEGSMYQLRVLIPANVRAEVWVRCPENGTLRENGVVRKDVQYRNGYAVVEVGSGEWSFEAGL
jgi:alpha-L-rhamnosidase